MGVTQYTFSAEQEERVLMSSAATRTMNDVESAAMTEEIKKLQLCLWSHKYSTT